LRSKFRFVDFLSRDDVTSRWDARGSIVYLRLWSPSYWR